MDLTDLIIDHGVYTYTFDGTFRKDKKQPRVVVCWRLTLVFILSIYLFLVIKTLDYSF